jgi:hypothetical protein
MFPSMLDQPSLLSIDQPAGMNTPLYAIMRTGMGLARCTLIVPGSMPNLVCQPNMAPSLRAGAITGALTTTGDLVAAWQDTANGVHAGPATSGIAGLPIVGTVTGVAGLAVSHSTAVGETLVAAMTPTTVSLLRANAGRMGARSMIALSGMISMGSGPIASTGRALAVSGMDEHVIAFASGFTAIDVRVVRAGLCGR